jgi:hypothetical protein
VVGAIQGENFSRHALEQIERMIEPESAARLVSAVIQGERASCGTDEGAVSQTMSKLQSLANISQPAACILMGHLWAIASDLYMHDVSDSIDLWIVDCDSDRLIVTWNGLLCPKETQRREGMSNG